MQLRLLRHAIDVWPTMLIVTVFTVQLLSFLYVSNLWVLSALAIALLPMCLSVVAYNHNHIHAPTFVHSAPNRVLEIMMFFATGSSPSAGTINHIIGHHATYFQPDLDTLNWRRKDGSQMARSEFAIKGALRHYPSCFTLGKQRPALFRQFLVLLVICVALLGVAIAYRPASALIILVFPMGMMLYALKWAAYPHHTGLPIGDHYAASRTHTGRLYNRITWNAGYHAAHHFKQALHWSRLPEYHATLASRMPTELQGPGWGQQRRAAAVPQ